MLRVLFIGDIVGKIGRQTVGQILPKLKKEKKIDVVIANAENSAHGSGITEKIILELEAYGVDYFTNGDHALGRVKQADLYERANVLRPANLPPINPGNGQILIPYKKKNILLINLLGRVFMKADYDCPFRIMDEILANARLSDNNIFAIIIDIHTEATAEKIALAHYVDGKVSAVLGTHTHVPTADAQISQTGTAFITDVGMVGADNSCLGIAKEGIIRTFISQIKEKHVIPQKGPAVFNAVLLEIDSQKKRTNKIQQIIKYITIN